MIALTNGTVPRGIVAGMIPGGIVKVGDYNLSPEDWKRLVADVETVSGTDRLTEDEGAPKNKSKKATDLPVPARQTNV